jgi:hypothetical protein
VYQIKDYAIKKGRRKKRPWPISKNYPGILLERQKKNQSV